MSTLTISTVAIKGADFLNLGTGTVDSKGHSDGVTLGRRKWGLIAQYIRQEGADMLLAFIDDYVGTSESVDASAAPAPVAVQPAPVPAPVPVKPATPAPAPVAVKPAPAPAPKGKTAHHSLDYCPTRMTVNGIIMGLRDGVIYRWHAPKGLAPHYRRDIHTTLTPADFATPAVAPTIAPAPVKPAPRVPVVPVAECETLPPGVLSRFERDGMIVTLYLPLPGESTGRYTLAPAPARVG